MDYEKKYKEAFEIARDIHDGNPSSGTAITVCEQIFPELAESKDEWIRKELIEYIKNWRKGYCSDSTKRELLDRFITWVDKQKPVEWSKEDEKILDEIIDVLDGYDISHLYSAGLPNEINTYIAWLKSLSPKSRWKPNEVQMTSLYDTIVQTKGQQCSIYLSELYKQLKEL